MSTKIFRIGTRRSDLALVQTELVSAALRAKFAGIELQVVPILTSGDKKQGTEAAAFGDKKDWIAEIEHALGAGEIDFAVHSAKDVPVDIAVETDLLPVLGRENPLDVLIANGPQPLRLAQLPKNAVLGTASLRRIAQLKQLRRDITIRPIRGNVPTRVRKLGEDPALTGIVLAEAGVARLGLQVALTRFTALEIVPAVNQGILATQFVSARSDVRELLETLVHPATRYAFQAERACVATLGADCKSALGVYAETKSGQVSLLVRVLSPDGSRKLELSQSAPVADAVVLGADIAAQLLQQGAAELLAGEPV